MRMYTRNHVDALVDEIDCGGSEGGLLVDGGARPDEVRHVGDVHPDLEVAVLQVAAVKRVVDVRTAGRIHRADVNVAQVPSLGDVLWAETNVLLSVFRYIVHRQLTVSALGTSGLSQTTTIFGLIMKI